MKTGTVVELPKLYPSMCQECIWQLHPEMLTGYCIVAHCDECGRYSTLAMTKREVTNGR